MASSPFGGILGFVASSQTDTSASNPIPIPRATLQYDDSMGIGTITRSRTDNQVFVEAEGGIANAGMRLDYGSSFGQGLPSTLSSHHDGAGSVSTSGSHLLHHAPVLSYSPPTRSNSPDARPAGRGHVACLLVHVVLHVIMRVSVATARIGCISCISIAFICLL